jgi:hypothetical protein
MYSLFLQLLQFLQQFWLHWRESTSFKIPSDIGIYDLAEGVSDWLKMEGGSSSATYVASKNLRAIKYQTTCTHCLWCFRVHKSYERIVH